jgi:hypothetical protein
VTRVERLKYTRDFKASLAMELEGLKDNAACFIYNTDEDNEALETPEVITLREKILNRLIERLWKESGR